MYLESILPSRDKLLSTFFKRCLYCRATSVARPSGKTSSRDSCLRVLHKNLPDIPEKSTQIWLLLLLCCCCCCCCCCCFFCRLMNHLSKHQHQQMRYLLFIRPASLTASRKIKRNKHSWQLIPSRIFTTT